MSCPTPNLYPPLLCNDGSHAQCHHLQNDQYNVTMWYSSCYCDSSYPGCKRTKGSPSIKSQNNSVWLVEECLVCARVHVMTFPSHKREYSEHRSGLFRGVGACLAPNSNASLSSNTVSDTQGSHPARLRDGNRAVLRKPRPEKELRHLCTSCNKLLLGNVSVKTQRGKERC